MWFQALCVSEKIDKLAQNLRFRSKNVAGYSVAAVGGSGARSLRAKLGEAFFATLLFLSSRGKCKCSVQSVKAFAECAATE